MSFRGTSGQGMMTTPMAIDPSKHAGLERVGDFPFAVFASTDVVPRARDIAERGARALRFLGSALDVEPELALLFLAPDDWEGRASHPVYCMPNCEGAGNRVGAGAPSEMGHRLHQVGVVRFPRLWLAEFFCNLCLHTYVAEEEPEALDVLEAFPAAVAAVPPEHMAHDDLGTFEQIYDRMPPHNYGWYQCRLHAAAKRVYDAGGPVVLRRLWNRFRLSDAELIVALHELEPELGRFLTEWTPTGRTTAEP